MASTSEVPDLSNLTELPMSAAQAKEVLENAGCTIKDWSDHNKFDYNTVLKVLNGTRKAKFGLGHQIAIALGLKKQHIRLLCG